MNGSGSSYLSMFFPSKSANLYRIPLGVLHRGAFFLTLRSCLNSIKSQEKSSVKADHAHLEPASCASC